MSQTEGQRLAGALRASAWVDGSHDICDNDDCDAYDAVVEAIDGKTCERVDVGAGKFSGCSACKEISLHSVDNYCPNCGSRIVGDSDGQ